MATRKLTAYELKRLENIRRNKERLASLNIPSMGDQPSASTKRRRCVPHMVEANQQRTVTTRKGKEQEKTVTTWHPESSSLSPREDIPNEDIPNESTHEEEEVEELNTMAIKRKGRGPAKGDKGYGTNAHVFRKRIVSPKALRSIWPLFMAELQGPFTTWGKYPQKELDRLFRLWRNKKFNFNCSEEELKEVFSEHIKRNYSDWMSEIRNSVFLKHKTAAARYANNPSCVSPDIWTLMVDDWLDGKWQDESKRNAANRDKLAMLHTAGSVPMAKYIKEEIDKTGVEPSPIEMFRMFHISKTKDDQPEEWASAKAEKLYYEMRDQKHMEEMLGDGEERLDDWGIYKEMVAKPKHGKILGLGDGMEPPNDNRDSSSQTCTNRSCLEREKEFGELKQEVGTLKDGLADMKQLLQVLIARESPSASASPMSPAIAIATATITKATDGDAEARGH